MDTLIDSLAAQLGLSGVTLIVTLMVVSKAANMVSRIIPDDAKGFKGLIRKVCTVVGLYASNRVASGVTQADVAKGLVSNGAMVVQRGAAGRFEKLKTVTDKDAA